MPAFVLRWWGRIVFAGLLVGTAGAAFGAGDDSSSGSYGSSSPGSEVFDELLSFFGGSGTEGLEPRQAWAVLVAFALVALCRARQREELARALGAELSPEGFRNAAGDPAEQVREGRLGRLRDRIRAEQHAPLIMYHEARPFCGAGAAQETWVLAVELRPDSGRKQQPLSNRAVLEKVRPLVDRLRLPAEHAGDAARDRLRRLEVDECVFLPAEGSGRREELPLHTQEFEKHRVRAVEEGGEKRRHFLRVRVGGWEEELVVTVFVRVHTQGRMLMLEVAPHVLLPVRGDFKEADRTAHQFRHNHVFGKAAWAVARVPRSATDALAVCGRATVYGWRMLTGGHSRALPDGPALSVRELGSAPAGSQFQDMDVARYLKTVQDRVANGVRAALADSGYATGEFVQKIVNVSQGAVHIGRVEGSTFAVGSHASASTDSTVSTDSGGDAPRKGTDTDVDR